MLIDRNFDENIDSNGVVNSDGNFGSFDFDSITDAVPDWLTDLEHITLTDMDAGIEEPIQFFRDMPRDQFRDRATTEVIEFDPNRNPTFTVGREYLQSDRSDLIDSAATLLKNTLDHLRPYVAVQQPVLSRVVTDEVRSDGHILKGAVYWTASLVDPTQIIPNRSWQSSPVKTIRVEIPMIVTNGMLERPMLFHTSSNRPYPLTVQGCRLALNWHERPLVRRRAPGTEIAWTTEKDYRAW